MGLLDRFGVGGGKITVAVDGPASAGAPLLGTISFGGGKRDQKVTALKVWLAHTRSYDKATRSSQPIDNLVAPPVVVTPGFTVAAGEDKSFPFAIDVPQTVINSVKDAIEYAVVGSADIDGEIDPQARTAVEIVGGIAVQVG